MSFFGRKRIFVVWVARISLGESSWEPIACMKRVEAIEEARKARRNGEQAFVCAYMKQKRTKNDRATEEAAEI